MSETATTELRGLALLDAAIARTEAHPETWNQEDYRCETGMCVAGHACEIAGRKWATPASDPLWSDCLIAEDYDPRALTFPIRLGDAEVRVVTAADCAARLIGHATITSAGCLFGAYNTLADIKRIRDEIAAGVR